MGQLQYTRKVKMEKLLKLENVSYSYQDGKEKNKILEHVSYLKKVKYMLLLARVEVGKQRPFPFHLV